MNQSILIMRILYSIFMLSCCLCIASCATDPVFPREYTIKQELMRLQGITNAVNVEVKHPFLMIWNFDRNDSLLHIYDVTTHELKHAFGIKGRGPGEFINPWFLKSQLSDFLIYNNKMVYQFGIDEEGVPILLGVKEPNYIGDIYGASFINDTLFVLDAQYLAPSLYVLSIHDELPRKVLPYRNPDIRDYIIDPNSGYVYANESRIAFCYQFKKQIDFMDIDLNLIKRVKFKYDHPTGIIVDEGNQKVSYTLGYLGKRYLYVLFFGKSWRAFRALPIDSGIFLEVFDLDGNPVVKYRLDGLGPEHFVVDEETFTLYGVGWDRAPEDHLLMYQLVGLK